MASSINASTSGPGGVITTADNSGILQLQSGGNTVATVNSSGLSTVGSLNVPNTFGFKNRLINGGMQIWQRGTSLTVGSATYTYTADRFKVYSANTSTTVSRNTSVPTGFQYSFQLQRTASNTGTNLLSVVQIIETANCYDLAGQSVTLSFWVKKGANYSGGNITTQVLTGTVADQGGDPYAWTGLATAVNDSTYTPTTTWTKVSYTGTVASNVLEIAPVVTFTPTGTAGADDSLYITGVQLELGSQATSFDFRSYGTELALCQRYLPAFNSVGAANQVEMITTGWVSNGASTAQFIFNYIVAPRVRPTGLTCINYNSFQINASVGGGLASSVTFLDASTAGARIQVGQSGMTTGQACQLYYDNTTSAVGQLLFTGCEL